MRTNKIIKNLVSILAYSVLLAIAGLLPGRGNISPHKIIHCLLTDGNDDSVGYTFSLHSGIPPRNQ